MQLGLGCLQKPNLSPLLSRRLQVLTLAREHESFQSCGV